MIDKGGELLTDNDIAEILKPDPVLEKATKHFDLSLITSSSSTPIPEKFTTPKTADVTTEKITSVPRNPARKILGIPSAKLIGRRSQQ